MIVKLFRMILFMTSFFLIIHIIGCGQSGPLILPKPNVVSPGNNSTTATTDDGDQTTASPKPTLKTVI